MNPHDDFLLKSPSSTSPPGSVSSNQPAFQPSTSPSMAYLRAPASPLPISFHRPSSSSLPFSSPYPKFDSFSATAPPSSYPQITEFKVETAAFVTPTGTGSDTGGRDEEGEFSVPQPLESLQGAPIPPFLSKIFDLVDDPSLDKIISWGSAGESFVVWDPVEFSRFILPQNFKHNNFSSFVRQLNTYGFHKIDADRWEFANEAFMRGKRHLLKKIQRRKSPQSHQIGSSSEAGKTALESEIEKLTKEKSSMMQEVIDLQRQQHGTIQHMEAVNEKLQVAEQKQKQMISFVAKVMQNPTFLARLQQRTEQRNIGSSRTMRKFIKHHLNEPGKLESSSAVQIEKPHPDEGKLTASSLSSGLDLIAVEHFPAHVSQTIEGNLGLGAKGNPSDFANIVSDEVDVVAEILNSEHSREGIQGPSIKDPLFKGKHVMDPQPEVIPEFFVSFPEDLVKEKNFPNFPSPGIEKIVKEEDAWDLSFEAGAGMSSSSTELWGNLNNYDMQDYFFGLPDIWDVGSPQAAGSTGIQRWLDDPSPSDELDSQAGPCKDNSY